MGFLSSLKKLFFATESVAESSIEKTADYLKEKGHDISEKTGKIYDSAKSEIQKKAQKSWIL